MEDPTTITYVPSSNYLPINDAYYYITIIDIDSAFRILYISVQVSLCLVAFMMIKKVQTKNDQTPLRYQEAQPPFSQE
jgi:hypothetical protein